MAIKFLSGQTITGDITLSGDITAATFNGLAINSTGTNNAANQIVRTQGNGYANFGWINSVSGNHTGSITRITASDDAYLRYVTPAQFRTGVTDGFYAPSSTVTGVTSVATGNGLTGGTIISTGTLTMASSYTGGFTFNTSVASPIHSGTISTSGDGQNNYPFRLGSDYSAYMVAVAGNTWGLFWAGNSGARYGTNGNGGPGNIWSNSTNPNEFCFVGGDSTRWSVQGSTGDTWQLGNIYLSGTFIRANNNLTLQVYGAGTPVSAITIDNVGSTTFSGFTYFPNYLFHAGDTNTRIFFETGKITLRGDTSIFLDGPVTANETIKTSGESIGTTQADGDYLAKLYTASADGFLELFTGEGAPVSRIKLSSYGDSYIDAASTGNVGIGTTSPAAKLHIQGGAIGVTTGQKIGWLYNPTASTPDNNMYNYIKTADNGGVPASPLEISGSNWTSSNTRGVVFTHVTGGEIMTIMTGGNVGIGTTTPDNQLTVKATNCIIDAQSTADSQTIGLRAGYLNNADLCGFFRYTTGDAQLYIDNNFTGNNGVYSDINFRNKTAGNVLTSRMKIKGSTGNVGIGTDDPDYTLHLLKSSGDTEMYINGQNGQSSLRMGLDARNWQIKTAAAPYLWSLNYVGTDFQTPNIITAKTTGNVGIGTTTPNRPLTIQSNSGATALSIYARSQDDYGFIQFFGYNQTTLWSEIAGRPSNLSFYQNSNEVLRLGVSSSFFPSGKVGIGVTNPNAQLDVGGASTNQVGMALFTESSTIAYLTTSFNTRPTHTLYGINTTNTYVGTRLSHAGNTEFFHGIVKGASNGEIKYVFQGYNGTAYQEFGYIDCYTTNAGSLIMSGDVVAYSDKKLKKNIKTLDGSKVYKMRGVSFDRIDTGKKSSGVIAQEMQEVAPELVNESGDTLGVAYGNITGYLIEAIKEQQKQIEDLQAQIKNISNTN